jgi:clan AA aspartic protease
MGLVYADITLSNPRREDIHPIRVKALVDSSALHLCLPPEVALQLGLEEQDQRSITLADGGVRKIPYVGPIKADYEGRFSFCGAMVLGDEVLLGAVPMEDIDIIIDPQRQRVIVNPAHPNIPGYKIK